MAEELQDNDTPNDLAMETLDDIETKIHSAMLSRVAHFKEQADSLTFEGVRRLLEKDLCLETYALDVHKRYIKQCLVKCLEGVEDDNASKDSEETAGISASREEGIESLEGSKKGAKEPCLEDEEKMEDSPVMGLLTGNKTTKIESEGTEDNDDKEAPSESTIKKAIRKRIPYFKANSEKITMAGVRRLLEDDLKLTKYELDSFKKFISQQVEEILNSCEAAESDPDAKKRSHLKASKKAGKESSHSTDANSSEEESDEVKPRKKAATRGRKPNSTEIKKRKRPAKETVSAKKQSKHVHPVSENSSEHDGASASEEDHTQSSNDKSVKKEVSTPVYGKRVEHLKTLIKSCGMSVPPSIYKKTKQVPESKRESQLIKELEGILSREGLSANPTEKEIKDVKKRKERAKELEGIDVSNIVSSSRRRSTTSFVPPPAKPKIPVETDGNDNEDTEEEGEENDDEEEEDDDDDDEEEEDAEENDDVESQSEEFNEDDNEDSD